MISSLKVTNAVGRGRMKREKWDGWEKEWGKLNWVKSVYNHMYMHDVLIILSSRLFKVCLIEHESQSLH